MHTSTTHTPRQFNRFNLWGILISLVVNAAFGAGILYASSSSDAVERPDVVEKDPEVPVKTHEILSKIEVLPPKLGQKPEEQKLPTLANKPPPSDRDTVNPNEKPKDPIIPPPPRPPNITRTPPPPIPTFQDNTPDPFRPFNDIKATGTEDGSKSGQNHIGQGDPYLQYIKAQLDNNMVIPSTIPPSARKQLRARIRIMISTNGQIMWDWMPGGPSNNQAFNDMITRSLNDFRLGGPLRFRAPPPEHTGAWISITVDGGSID